MTAWTTAEIPVQTGKTAIVTGANSGIGFYTAFELARAGAKVIIAARNEAKGLTAAAAINDKIPGSPASFEWLDLASLASVASFAARVSETLPALDMLINNAGVMALPSRQVTEDGFEMQFGVNYLGHFALTAQLLPLLRTAAAPRTVQLSSIAHRTGKIDFADLQSARKYVPWTAYNQSKLAMLIFAFELQRRSDANGWNLLSVAAHPGVSVTELMANGPGTTTIVGRLGAFAVSIIGQSAAAGALPTLLAATAPVTPGGYYGPTGFQELRGAPGIAVAKPQAKDLGTAKRLWEISEELTKTSFA